MIYKYMKENRDYNRKLKNCFHCRLGCDANTRCEILIKLREKYSEGEEEAFAKELTETKCDGPKGGFEKLKLPDGKLFAIVNGYVRKTNKIEADLPRSFVKLMSPSNIEQFVQAKGVVDIQYHWVKENHVFKDSCIFVSYTNKFDEDDFTGTKEKYANAVSYTNSFSLAFSLVWPAMITMFLSTIIGLRNPNSWIEFATCSTASSLIRGLFS